ncbi:MAG TPA: hypothetical protein VFW15_15595, partial [Thermoanaerobaculia bacterium]|nr:hypothetical protein [Thermoanaerobaculia bacterium]
RPDRASRRKTRMSLSPDQRKFYEHTLEMTRKEISEVEGQIQEELAKVKDRLAELQNAQKAARQMYDAACMRLGIPNDLEEAESQG